MDGRARDTSTLAAVGVRARWRALCNSTASAASPAPSWAASNPTPTVSKSHAAQAPLWPAVPAFPLLALCCGMVVEAKGMVLPSVV